MNYGGLTQYVRFEFRDVADQTLLLAYNTTVVPPLAVGQSVKLEVILSDRNPEVVEGIVSGVSHELTTYGARADSSPHVVVCVWVRLTRRPPNAADSR